MSDGVTCDVDGCDDPAYSYVWPEGDDQLRARCLDCYEFDKNYGTLTELNANRYIRDADPDA